jgi:O-antigen/teichoic acid export membrane protein
MKRLGERVAHGAALMVVFKILERSLGLVSTLILVRLLIPSDFGLIAMATSVIAILEVMGAFSFDTVLIHKQKAGRVQYDTAWTFNIIVSTAIAILLLLLSAPAAKFYGEPRLVAVIAILAVGSWVQGFENIGVVEFRKSLEFGKEFRFLLIKKIIAFSVTVPLAFLLRNYWALVIGTIVGKFGQVIVSYLVHSYRPHLSLSARHELLHFSKWLLLNNIILLVRDRSADFTIGRLLGTHQLGLYAISHEISQLPTTELSAPINRAIYPAYAKQAHDLAQLRHSFIQVTSMLWLIVLPAGTGIALTSPLIVEVALGTNWIEAIPLLQILAIFGTLLVLQDNTAYVFYALGKPRITTFLTLSYVLVLVPLLLFLTSTQGAVGAAWAHLVTTALFVPVAFLIVFRHLRLAVGVFARSVWRALASMLIMAATVKGFLGWMSADQAPALLLLEGVVLGVVTYVAAIAAFWWVTGQPTGAESFVLGRLRKFYSLRKA